ncbi:hypothetical protein K7432_010322 [Basidiobolus ranarum]|uniref:Methyltransferase type 12 domain-containing protein n=1 Tax=Basidiobolus ranarum TaxID=34480 RepID=A0ABR2WNX3_9FUNG
MTDISSIENELFLKYFSEFLEANFFSKGNVGPVRILEVGCGKGDFFKFLLNKYQDKISIIGIDQEKVIVEAKERLQGFSFGNGSRLLPVGLLEYKEESEFDVVLFTKSLHHIFPLDKAVEHAYSLIRTGGYLVAEEFQRNDVSKKTIHWFFDRVNLIKTCGLIENPNPEKLSEHRRQRLRTFFDVNLPTKERWEVNFLNHNPPLPSKQELLSAVTAVFGEKNTHLEAGLPFLFHLVANSGYVMTCQCNVIHY